jgi:hypothetical protein
MTYLALGCAALALWLWLTGRRKPVFKRREWRLMSAAFALAAFTGAAWVGLRGSWGAAIVLVVLGLWLAASARSNVRPAAASPREPVRRMSEADARALLGVTPEADRAEIEAAYKRLMRMAHPDSGGTTGLAAQLNAARDRLLKR